MKRWIFVFVCLFGLLSMAQADNDKPIKVSEMPQLAQQFIKKHFANQRIAMAKMETEWFDKSYDVIFTNGNKVEFDKQGNWKEVDCKYGFVPASIVPAPIFKYLTENYSGMNVLKIERDKKEYEVKLSNKLELTFDLNFILIGIDD